ncbi:MAG: thiamine pyrophosphate-dependent enzyme [Candidatus Bathyarchaeia archaeon]
MPLAIRHVIDTVGERIVVVRSGGCGSWVHGQWGKAILRIPAINSVLPGGGATVSGVSRALRAKGLTDVYVVCIGGDGSTGDMGFQALSGAMERNEDIICVPGRDSPHAAAPEEEHEPPSWDTDRLLEGVNFCLAHPLCHLENLKMEEIHERC